MKDKIRFEVLKNYDIPRMLLEEGKDYVNGYTYALYSHRLINVEKLNELRSTYIPLNKKNMRYITNMEKLLEKWKCPVCGDYFTEEEKKEHILREIKDFSKALECLKYL
jgi:hypothetical protein